MTDPQELANRIGATQRSVEAAIASGDTAQAARLLVEQHGQLTEAFAYLRDEQGMNLDWDAVAGNGQPGGGEVAARGGGAKDAPATVEA